MLDADHLDIIAETLASVLNLNIQRIFIDCLNQMPLRMLGI